jgi:hypothetical protein
VVDLSRRKGQFQTGLRVYPIVSDNQTTGWQPRFANERELAEIDALLAEKRGWKVPARTAVKRGADESGRYLVSVAENRRVAHARPSERRPTRNGEALFRM